MNDPTRARSGVAIFAMLLFGIVGLTSASAPLRQEPGLEPFVIYFDDGPFPVGRTAIDGEAYLPLVDLVRHLALPYTDATALETFTIRGPRGTLAAAHSSREIMVGDRAVELDAPVLRRDGRWYATVEFLRRGLSEVTGTEFRSTNGPRLLAGGVRATDLDMEASETGGVTRLTIRSGASVNVRVQQIRRENRVILSIDRAPMDPDREALDYRDASVRSVAFDDADGRSKIVVETTPQVANVRLVPSDENRTFFVDFIPEAAPAETTAAPAPEVDTRPAAGSVRVIVIDPGHGGLDGGSSAGGTLEKDLTLALARRLRTVLEARLSTTVILTRDADREMTGETRSAIANNSRADLLISLHVGYSMDPTESSGSLFVMRDAPGDPAPATSLFRPWFQTHRAYRIQSRRFAAILAQRLGRAVPGWTFPLREAPISVLASAASPAIVVELGNANNPANVAALVDPAFQSRLIDAMVESIIAFGGPGAGGAE